MTSTNRRELHGRALEVAADRDQPALLGAGSLPPRFAAELVEVEVAATALGEQPELLQGPSEHYGTLPPRRAQNLHWQLEHPFNAQSESDVQDWPILWPLEV